MCNDFQVFSGVFASISDACLKWFICLQMYVASVASECFKSRSGVAHIAMAPVADRQGPAAGLRQLPRGAPRPPLSSPSSPFLSLPSISTWQFELGARDDADA